MALTDSFPGPNGLTDSIEAGKDLAALVAHENGAPKAGLTWRSSANVLVPRSDLRVDVVPFKAVLVRDGAVRLLANDDTAQSPEFTVPTANSRIDVLYVKVGESAIVGGETDGPFFGILQGQPAAIPLKPTLTIPGALELGTVQVSSSATATNSAGVTVRTTAALTGAARPAAATVELLATPLITSVPPVNVIGGGQYPWTVDEDKSPGRANVLAGVSGSTVTVLPGTYIITAEVALNNGGSPQPINGRSFIEVVAGEPITQPRIRANASVGEDSWSVCGVRTFNSTTPLVVNVLASKAPNLAGSNIRLIITRVG